MEVKNVERVCMACSGQWNKPTNNYFKICNNCYNEFIMKFENGHIRTRLNKFVKHKQRIKDSIEAWK